MKVLINTPDLSGPGGVINHYLGLKDYWTYDVSYNEIGKRINYPIIPFIVFDILKFIYKCIFVKYDLIVLNPSLRKNSLIRDSIFLIISSLFKIKTIIFFHGWDKKTENQISKFPFLFLKIYSKAFKFIVLSNEFKDQLNLWGIRCPIEISSTKVDDKLISAFDLENKIYDQNILFLSRVEDYKGIFILLEAYKELKINFPKISLTIAGDGSKLELSKEFVLKNKLRDVIFSGEIKGQELIKVFSKSSIYVLPSFAEGMPTSLLEAMAFGIPVITRPVGGLKDFFKENKMGYFVDSLQPHDFSKKIKLLIENRDDCKKIGQFNHKYAKKHFLASIVANNLEKIFKD